MTRIFVAVAVDAAAGGEEGLAATSISVRLEQSLISRSRM
jgi:hypothetical protein